MLEYDCPKDNVLPASVGNMLKELITEGPMSKHKSSQDCKIIKGTERYRKDRTYAVKSNARRGKNRKTKAKIGNRTN